MIKDRIAVASILLLATTLVAQTRPGAPRLLADLGQSPNVGSDPGWFTAFRGACYFVAGGDAASATIHRYDGSPGTAVSVVDPQPRSAFEPPSLLTATRAALYFATGRKLWVSDGTAAGTAALAGLQQSPMALGAVGDRLLIVTRDGVLAAGGGQRGVVDLQPAAPSIRPPVIVAERQPAPGGGEWAWFSYTLVGEQSLWVTDGTIAGTRRVGTVPFDAAALPQDAVSIAPGQLVFTTVGLTDGSLWFADAVAGTVIPVGPANRQSADIVLQGTRAVAVAPATPGVLAYIFDGSNRIDVRSQEAAQPAMLGVIGNTVWLQNGDDQLLRLDAGAAQAVVAGRAPRPRGEVVTIQDRFVYVDRTSGDLIDLVPAFRQPRTILQTQGTTDRIAAIPALGEVVFDAAISDLGREPWSYRAASRDAALIADLASSRRGDSDPTRFTRFGDRVVFETSDAATGLRTLWSTDGTEAGTRRLPLPANLPAGGSIQVVAAHERLWVIENRRPARIHFTDGSPAGTGVAAVIPDPIGPAFALGSDLLLADGTIVGPTSRDSLPVQGRILDVTRSGGGAWLLISNQGGLDVARTDGSAQGYRVVGSATVSRSSILGAELFGGQLWFSTPDGTFVATTTGVRPVPAVSGSYLVTAGDRLFAFAFGNGELRTIDAAGAIVDRLSIPQMRGEEAVAIGERVLFTAANQAWITDGTAAGSVQLTEPGPRFGVAQSFQVAGPDQALFVFTELLSDSVLVTDGTRAGTRAIASDLEIGPTRTPESRPLLANGHVYWSIRTPETGREPHVVDLGAAVETVGTACGGDPLAPASLRVDRRPTLGSLVTLEARGSGARFGTLLFGAPALRPTPLPGIGCAVHVDAATLAATPVLATDAAGALRASLGIPSIPALTGVDLAIQAVLAASPTGLDQQLSPALRLTLGD